MIIDDLKAAIDASQPVQPFFRCAGWDDDGHVYVAIMHPKMVDDLRRWEARDRYYWERHVERYNRRAARLGLQPIPLDYEGEVGSMFGTVFTEGA